VLTRVERDAQQRARLLRAGALALGDSELTVARVIGIAGVGRSTFYEFFDDPAHLQQELTKRFVQSATQDLKGTLDTSESAARQLDETQARRLLANIAEVWIALIEQCETEARALLSGAMGQHGLSLAIEPLRLVVERFLRLMSERGSRAWVDAHAEVQVLAALAAAQMITRRHLMMRLAQPQLALLDIFVRMLRA
jgi:AcrR family transcriptional regulator